MKNFIRSLFLVGLLVFALVPVFSIGSAPMPTGNPGGKTGNLAIGSAPMPTGNPGGKKGSLVAIGSAPMPTGKKPSKPKKG